MVEKMGFRGWKKEEFCFKKMMGFFFFRERKGWLAFKSDERFFFFLGEVLTSRVSSGTG